MNNIFQRFAREFRRVLSNHRYEKKENGDLFLPAQGLVFSGVWSHSLNNGPYVEDQNLVVNEGLNYFLSVALAQGVQIANFYVAPYSGAYTPVATLNAASFNTNATEFTNYTETTRPLWVEGSVASQVVNNNSTPALITISNGGVTTVSGAALISESTKNSSAGTLISCVRFSAARTGLTQNDELRFKYQIAASSA